MCSTKSNLHCGVDYSQFTGMKSENYNKLFMVNPLIYDYTDYAIK